MFYRLTIFLSTVITNLGANTFFNSGPQIQHELSLGVYKATDIESDMNLGYGYYRLIDESVSVGFAVDLFTTNYTKLSDVGVPDTTGLGQEIITQQVEVDMTSYLLPLMGSAKIRFPIEFGPLSPFGKIELGWNNLFNNETNYVTEERKLRFFNGFGWTFCAGTSFELGDKTSINFEMLYRNAKMKANVDKTEAGLPIFDELNMSGLGIQLGLLMSL